MNEPNFFIVGAPKCGTTALFDYLSQHPNAWCPVEKEPNFFATDFPPLRGPKSQHDYLRLFEGADESHIAIGEASVLYFFSQDAVPEIRRCYPEAKIIILVRNPADMVYSFHSQLFNTINENEANFERAWALQDSRLQGKNIPKECLVPDFLQYRDIGRLSRNIYRVLEHFPREQLKLVVFDDLKDKPEDVFADVCSWLGLPAYSGVDFRVVNANRIQKSRVVAKYTERPPSRRIKRIVKKLKRVLGLQDVALRRVIARMNTRAAPRPKLSPDMRRTLLKHFDDEISELEKLCERDLAHWRS